MKETIRRNLKKIVIISGFLLVAILAAPHFTGASSNTLPQIMVGGTKVTNSSGVVSYAWQGNEVIFNSDVNNPLLGFIQSSIENCDLSSTTPPRCYSLDSPSSSIKLMTSRTSVNDRVVSEIAALYYPNIVVGDVYGLGSSNFALYGRNLNKNSATTNGTWNVSGYTMNPQAQANYKTDSESQKYFDTHYNKLFGEAALDSAIGMGNWYLQSDSSSSPSDLNASASNPSLYPEGKVWKTISGGLTIDNNVNFNGKGTIIVDGNLIIESGNNIKKVSGGDLNTLGLIVLGDVTLKGNNNIEAAIFATGTMKIGSNVKMTGSFVAQDFNATGSSGVQILYDYKLEGNWPPGFRYFNMPSAENAAP